MSDEILLYNTEDKIKIEKTEEKPKKIFNVYSEHHPLLHQELAPFDFQNPPVNPNEFASTLVETCKAYNGIGLSANQCGFPYRVFVMGAGDEYVAHYNPKVINAYGESHMDEGCLSFPFLFLKITRPERIDVEYQDFNGVTRTATYNGISARCFLHELDHMNGIVYTMRAKPLALKTGKKKQLKLIEQLKKHYANIPTIR